MTYKDHDWIMTNLQGTYDWKRIQLRFGHSQIKSTSSTTDFDNQKIVMEFVDFNGEYPWVIASFQE